MKEIFNKQIEINDNFIYLKASSEQENQQQTNDSFTEKWTKQSNNDEFLKSVERQKKWYLQLYGFESENDLSSFLRTKKYIFDAGCGLGYKAKWFADLAPSSIVIGMDFSDASKIAAKKFKDTKNLYFIKGDIADVPFKDNTINYVNCDQVIMHTEIPENTFKELTRVIKKNDEFACYVYAKKALPRELVDDYFRVETKNLSNEQLWEISRQLTELGKTLSELKVEVDIPDIPLLGIKGGKQDIQRFLYWNFLKCFWNEDMGFDNSVATNFDWYSPSNAKRYSEEEFQSMIECNALKIKYFHQEEACFSGRFIK